QPCNEPDLRLVDRHTRVAPGIAGGKPHRSLYPRVLEKMPFFNGLLSGPLYLSNSVDLQIDSGATLQMLPYSAYPGGTNSPTDFIAASKIHDVEISGSGTIDGQGGPWWGTNAIAGINRPKAMFAPTTCNRVLVRDITLQNPPNTHISFRSSSGVPCGNVTVTNIAIRTPDGTPNTDGIDMSATNALVVNSYITDGDDHIAMGDSGAFDHDITVTNCFFGTGHGVSIGSYTAGGLTNLFVINCTWSGSENGLRLKSERGRGGFVYGLTYENLSLTNVQWPILFYSYYNYGEGQLSSATPYMAATDGVQTVTSSTPIWRDITVSNFTATTASSYPAIMIWGLPEMLISNVTLEGININGSGGAKTCQFYYVTNFQLLNSQVSVRSSTQTYTFYGDQMVVSNSQPDASLATLNGLSTNGIANSIAFYNAPAAIQNTNPLAGDRVTLGAGTFTVSNNLLMPAETAFNFQLGTNAATTVVKGNLTLGGSVNVAAGSGFTNGVYTLFTYTGALNGSVPSLGSTPPGFNYAFDTSQSGQVNLDVTSPAPGAPANLTALGTNLLIELQWSASVGASGYTLMRSTTNGGPYSAIATPVATNYSDAAVNPGTIYYYVVAATNSFGASADSTQASAIPLPSLNPTNLNFRIAANRLQLSWPQDHLGWQLQIQTNSLSSGLGTNWATVPDSTSVTTTNLLISPVNDCVFYRLAYP
ncbi:MAG TPA: glycosyl hydrolase family 28 protein, partial [Verrucomicrobiae bacterium]|nr:glycosyl hydrolase family 28 protein [Verrucomicrobiae bacterium]